MHKVRGLGVGQQARWLGQNVSAGRLSLVSSFRCPLGISCSPSPASSTQTPKSLHSSFHFCLHSSLTRMVLLHLLKMVLFLLEAARC